MTGNDMETRREFMKKTAGLAMAGTTAGAMFGCEETRAKAKAGRTARIPDKMKSVREFLDKAVMKKEHIDRFLDPSAKIWAKFDPELGYLLRNYFMRDGVDGCHTLNRYEQTGQRKMVNFPDQKCRINTYGNSFTQCHQVSDGETWQEVLAAHFCEPIGNYGIGGHGFYQAYRRMLREEKTDRGARNIIINIWGDDHQRSINAWRYLTYVGTWTEAATQLMLHGNPWVYARLDPETGELVEHENDFSTPESLYKLCDADFVYEYFKDDPVVRIMTALQPGSVIDPAPIIEMAETVGIGPLEFGTWEQTRNSAWWVYNAYSWRVSMKIIDRVKEYAEKNDKNMLILLSYPEPSVREICEGKDRDEQSYLDWHPKSFRDYVVSKGLRLVDVLDDHLNEFRQFRLSAAEYTARYYIGHYNPRGNHFFAFAIKDRLIEWLDPKPPAYRDDKENLIRFEGYLPG